jgi:hypothetical protein
MECAFLQVGKLAYNETGAAPDGYFVDGMRCRRRT